MANLRNNYFELKCFTADAIDEMESRSDCSLMLHPKGQRGFVLNETAGKIIADIYKISCGLPPLVDGVFESYPAISRSNLTELCDKVAECKIDEYRNKNVNINHIVLLAAIKYLQFSFSQQQQLINQLKNALSTERELMESLLQSQTIDKYIFQDMINDGAIKPQLLETFLLNNPEVCSHNLMSACLESGESILEAINYAPFSLVGKTMKEEEIEKEISDIIEAYSDRDGVVQSDVASALINNIYCSDDIRNELFNAGCKLSGINNFTEYIANAMYCSVADAFFEETIIEDREKSFVACECLEKLIRSGKLSEAQLKDIWERILHEKEQGVSQVMRDINLNDTIMLVAAQTRDKEMLIQMLEYGVVPKPSLGLRALDNNIRNPHPLLDDIDVFEAYTKATSIIAKKQVYATLVMNKKNINRVLMWREMDETPDMITFLPTIVSGAINEEVATKGILWKVSGTERDEWENIARCLIEIKKSCNDNIKQLIAGLAMIRLYENYYDAKVSGSPTFTFEGVKRVFEAHRIKSWETATDADYDKVIDKLNVLWQEVNNKKESKCLKAIDALLKDVEQAKYENKIVSDFPALFCVKENGLDIVPEVFILMSEKQKNDLLMHIKTAPQEAQQHIAYLLFEKVSDMPHELQQAFMYSIKDMYEHIKDIAFEKNEANKDKIVKEGGSRDDI